jgi:hypothetical protein
MGRSTFTFDLCILLLVLPLRPDSLAADSPGKKPQGLGRTTTNDLYRPFLINNIFNYYGNNGDGSYNKYSPSDEGFEFPKGSDKCMIFEDGIVWGGFHKGYQRAGTLIPKFGGSVYRHALIAGRILTPGTASTDPLPDDPSPSRYRIFRVRPDINPAIPFDATLQLRLVAEEVAYIARYEPTTPRDLYDQYIRDWNEWPAADGAPFVDVNGDGSYDPSVDVPGVPGAAQTLWYVANDVDVRTTFLAGAPAIGLEIHRTIWGYKSSGPVGSTIFVSTMIINKSGAPVDSMFVAQWMDPDLGDPGDDCVGCDTTRALGFVYNGRSTDRIFGASPPAYGALLLQGPRVPHVGDTAQFLGHRTPGFRNIGMSAFVLFASSPPMYWDALTGAGGEIPWYRLMNGSIASSGAPFLDPTTGQPTKFCVPGDPASGSGWIDGMGGLAPGDRRMMLSSGPFTMANGDTQEIVLAHLGAQGTDRLSSVSLLKADADQVRSAFLKTITSHPPFVQRDISYPTPSQVRIQLRADLRPVRVQSVTAVLKHRDGSALPAMELYDDGTHGDATPHDGIFSMSATASTASDPLRVSLSVTLEQGTTISWDELEEEVTVAGPLTVQGPIIFSDNINNDGLANPSENVRYGITLENNTPFTLKSVSMRCYPTTTDSLVVVPSLPGGSSYSMGYNPADPGTFFSLNIPSSYNESGLPLSLQITDDRGNYWSQSLTMPVAPMVSPVRLATTAHIAGSAAGGFQVQVVDVAHVKSHHYQILGVDSVGARGEPGFTLVDSTQGLILLQDHELPDLLGHNIPVTDGFKILRGSVVEQSGFADWSAGGVRRFTYVGGDGGGLEGFNGAMGNSRDYWGIGIGRSRLRSVLITLAPAQGDGTFPANDPNVSYAYRFMQGCQNPPARPEFAPFIKNTSESFAYQDFVKGVPFAVYDNETTPPARLAVAFLENNVTAGRVDGKWWPEVMGTDNVTRYSPREWFWILDAPYTETPNSVFQTNIRTDSTLPLMWISLVTRRSIADWAEGDNFRIIVAHPPGHGDTWSFTLNRTDYLPASYYLYQNYPNPFNAGTTIRFDLPNPGRVIITIYNLLGQKVRTLLDGSPYPGQINVPWDGTNTGGNPVASGVYFYRLETLDATNPVGWVTQVKKMMVVR